MKLKEYPNHFEAWESFGDKMEPIFQTFFHLCMLYKLKQKAVSIKFPKGNEESIFVCYLEPVESEVEPAILEIRLHLTHGQEKAAKFCKVNERTLQRWMKDGLRSFKLGRQRIFIERDLWDYMAERGVGNLWKVMPDYVEGLCVDTNPIFQEKE